MSQVTDPRAVVAELGGLLSSTTGVPYYKQFGALVRGAITQGRLKPGEALPPQREMSQIVGISEVTIRRALQELAESGLLDARAGSGTIVLDPASPRAVKLAQSAFDNGLAQVESKPNAPLSLGIAFASLTDGYPFFRPMLEGLRSGAGRPVAVRLFDIAATEANGSLDHAPDLRGLDGLVMMSPVNLQLVALCQQRALPCVLLYTDIADGFSRCVVVDYAAGILKAARHLNETGRKRLALVTAGNERFSTGQITDAYHTAQDMFGFAQRDEYIIHAGYEEQDGHRAMQQLLKLSPRPDSVLFASDYQARGALLALHGAKLRVSKDIAIVGAGNVLGGTGWPVPLTTIDLRFQEVGAAACRIIEAQLAGQATTLPYRTSVRSSLIIGRTT